MAANAKRQQHQMSAKQYQERADDCRQKADMLRKAAIDGFA
jgi:hypothetical protein